MNLTKLLRRVVEFAAGVVDDGSVVDGGDERETNWAKGAACLVIPDARPPAILTLHSLCSEHDS